MRDFEKELETIDVLIQDCLTKINKLKIKKIEIKEERALDKYKDVIEKFKNATYLKYKSSQHGIVKLIYFYMKDSSILVEHRELVITSKLDYSVDMFEDRMYNFQYYKGAGIKQVLDLSKVSVLDEKTFKSDIKKWIEETQKQLYDTNSKR